MPDYEVLKSKRLELQHKSDNLMETVHDKVE